MPSPLRIQGLVLKVASRCNLNCSYCFVYNQGDTTYRNQPRFMSDAVADALLDRVGAYCRRHRIEAFRFVFHGGEPLLAPVSFFRRFVARAGQVLPAYTRATFALQTNGVLLTDAWCQALGELGIRVGISLDGPAAVHDAQRVDHRGRGSHARVVAGLQRAQAHPALRHYPGVLLVIDPATGPEESLQHFVRLGVRTLSLLLPHGTHHRPPPHLVPGSPDTPYADWLIRLFDGWFALPPEGRPRVPFFREIIHLILGDDKPSSYLGRQANVFLFVETDGGLEADDSLKVCADGFTKENHSVWTHSLDEALGAPLIAQCAASHQVLPAACRTCMIRDVCGGGLTVHRYHPDNGFDNPSVYCRDLLKLITHIQNCVVALLPPDALAGSEMRPVTYQEALQALEAAEARPAAEMP